MRYVDYFLIKLEKKFLNKKIVFKKKKNFKVDVLCVWKMEKGGLERLKGFDIVIKFWEFGFLIFKLKLFL